MRVTAVSVIVALSLSVSICANQRKPDTSGNDASKTVSPSQRASGVVINTSDASLNQSNGSNESDKPKNLWATFLERLVDPVTWFTLLLFGVSCLQWKAARRANKHIRAIERAYVGFSLKSPGLTISEMATVRQRDGVLCHDANLRLSITNHGSTPARVTRALSQVVLSGYVDPLPEKPAYDESRGDPTHVSLVKGDTLDIFTNSVMPQNVVNKLRTKRAKMYLIGYVDYIDRFGRRHRAGFGKVFVPPIDDMDNYRNEARVLNEEAYAARNNMAFVTQHGYNYDRRRKNGEGDDWNEPSE
jgi:hypothetical protein